MKKLIIAIASMAVATGAFAQGYVTFQGGSGNQSDTNATISPFFGGPGGGVQGQAANAFINGSDTFYVGLFVNSATYSGGAFLSDTNVFSGSGVWSFTGLQAGSNPFARGQTSVVNDSAANGWGIGSTQQYIFAAWSANLGSTWIGVSNLLNSALNGDNSGLAAQLAGQDGYFGVSAVSFAAAAAAPPAPASVLWSSTLGAQSYGTPIDSGIAMYIVPVPEPATLALAGLGGLGLLLFRRRRQ